MTYTAHQHKCLTCYFPIQDGEDEGFIKMSHQLRYYHVDWRDCQAALRNFKTTAETLQDSQELQEA